MAIRILANNDLRLFWTQRPAAIPVYTIRPKRDYNAATGRVAELADAKDLGSFGAILAGSTPVAPTIMVNS